MINSKTLSGLNNLSSVVSEMEQKGDSGLKERQRGLLEGKEDISMSSYMHSDDNTKVNFRRYGDGDKRYQWDYRQEVSARNPFEAGVEEDCGHRMNLFNPYEGQSVYSTVYGDNKYQGDFIFVSDGIAVYDYLTLPGLEEDNALLNHDNPSSHLP